MDVRAQVIELETKFWQTMIDKDVDTAVSLLAEPSIVTGATGAASIDKASFKKMMAGGKWDLHEFKFDDIQFNTPAPNVAVIGYKVTEKLTVDGKKQTLTAADASVWIKQGDKWLCSLHTESVLGDPFGRDKAVGSSR